MSFSSTELLWHWSTAAGATTLQPTGLAHTVLAVGLSGLLLQHNTKSS